MKLDEIIKCPYCGEESVYVFYDNSETIECHHCHKVFDIELETKVVVTATIQERICCICSNKFIADGDFEEDFICPKCGYKGRHYKTK